MRPKLRHFLFALWFVAISVPLGFAMLKHEVAFRSPEASRMVAGLETLGVKLDERWSLVHVLATDCGCSKSIVAHLVQRKPVDGAQETVVLLGEDEKSFAASLKQAQFNVISLPAKTLAETTGIAGVPWLLIFDPQRATAYSGGYTDRLINKDTRLDEVSWLKQLQAGAKIKALPAFGCAISQGLKRYLIY